MAHLVEEGVKEENLEAKSKKVDDTNLNDLLSADGIIIGSPTYFGSMHLLLKK
jgi:NAD(P)H dehydrogenase (quinone)